MISVVSSLCSGKIYIHIHVYTYTHNFMKFHFSNFYLLHLSPKVVLDMSLSCCNLFSFVTLLQLLPCSMNAK